MRSRLVVGCMTGTSIDALDASLVRIEGTGLSCRAVHVRSISKSLGSLAGPLRELAEQRPMSAGEIAALSHDFAVLHADAVEELCAGEKPDLISVHGQTVFHSPPVSWQMFQPGPLVRRLRTSVVFDLRAADLAAGGQGAPLTPLADWILLRDRGGSCAVVNLGGFSNITILPGGGIDQISARDVCPCNLLLDAIARERMGVAFDDGGRAAMSAKADPQATDDLARTFATSGSPRSLGTGDERFEWMRKHAAMLSGPELAASACAAIGNEIGRAIRGASTAFVAGGGAKNAALVHAIEGSSGCAVRAFDECGVPGAFRESVAWAILGALCEDAVPVTLPQVTGCASPAPVAGVWARV